MDTRHRNDTSFSAPLRAYIGVAILALVAFVLLSFSGERATFSSSELKFADPSPSGLSIVPASCPSSPHYSGQCNVTDSRPPPPGYSQASYYSQSSYYGQSGYSSCTPQYICSGNDRYYRNAQCQDSFIETCPYGCSGGACLPAPSVTFVSFTGYLPGPDGTPGAGPSFTATGHLQVFPSLVRSGDTTNLYWNAENVQSCSVTGSNGDSWTNTAFSGANGKTTGPITEQTTYTLSCTALSGASPSSVAESRIVNITPSFEEL